MSHISYTFEQLHQLRESPLCQKPPGLPSLDQWLQEANGEQNGQRRKQQNNRGDEQVNSEGPNASRPLFPTRHSARNNSEDIFLGPPGTKFGSSSRKQDRNGDAQEKGVDRYNTSTFGDDNDQPYSRRNRAPRDQDDDRPRNRDNLLSRRGNNRDTEGEGWSTVTRRRSSQNEEGAERWRPGDRDRTRKEGDLNKDDEQPRRNGFGRGGRMGAWRDEQAEGDGNRGVGRWRDRDREGDRDRDRDRDRENRHRDRDREWTRGHKVQDKVDEEPEWMSEPVVKPQIKEEKTQEDFERWKAEQKAKAGGSVEEKEIVPMFKDSKPAEPAKPLLDFSGFGTFGTKKVEAKQPEAAPTEKMPPLKGLGKTSKFGAYFQKEETPPPAYEPEPPVQHQPQQPLQALFQAQPPPQVASPTNGAQPSSKEDAEGFQRILQMLGGTKPNNPPPQQGPSDGVSLANALFPGMGGEPGQRSSTGTSRADSASLVNELLARHTANRSRGPQTAPAESDPASQYFPGSGGEYGRINGARDENITPRPGQLFSPTNGTRQRPETPTDQKRDFLLKLIEGNRAGKPQPQPNAEYLKQAQLSAVTAKGPLPQHMQPMQQEPQRITPSAPPGLHDAMFALGGVPEQELQALRKAQQGRPLPVHDGRPFYEEPQHRDPAILGMPGLVRRNTSEQQNGPPRPPISNMGIPTQQAPVDQFRMPHTLPPQDMGQQQRGGNMGPPPGFPNMPRPPPGFQPPPPHLQSPNGPPHPGMRGMPPGMFGGMVPLPPQGPHPGYFQPPPGFGGPPDQFFMQQQGRGRGGPPPSGFM